MSGSVKKKLLYWSGILCAACAVLCVAYVVYRIIFSADTPATFLITAFLSVMSLAGAVAVLAYTSRLTLRSLGILALHFGMVLFFIGIGIYSLVGAKYNVSMTPDPGASYSRINDEQSRGTVRTVTLPFEISLDSFEAVKYPDGSDKEYNAVLTFTEKRSRLAESVDISVNKPVRRNGYKIYLMGFSEVGEIVSVSMLIKRDPGEFVSLAGIICMSAGAFISAFAPEKRRKKRDGTKSAQQEADDEEGGEEN